MTHQHQLCQSITYPWQHVNGSWEVHASQRLIMQPPLRISALRALPCCLDGMKVDAIMDAVSAERIMESGSDQLALA